MEIQDRLVRSQQHSQRLSPPTCIVLHTTGTSQLEKALVYYQKNRDGICPNYVVGGDGTIYRTLSDDYVAYHCGHGATGELYQKGWAVWSRWAGKPPTELAASYTGYAMWRERWPGKESPLDLVTGAHPNARSLGIEFQASRRTLPEVFTDAQYAAGAWLVAAKAKEHGIPLDREHVIGHYDVNPVARVDSLGDKDPGRKFNWTRILDLARAT